MPKENEEKIEKDLGIVNSLDGEFKVLKNFIKLE